MKINLGILLFPYFPVKFCQERNGKMERCEGVRVKHLFLVVFTIPLFSVMLILFFTNSYTVTYLYLLCKS